jgi:uncharacterized membrane protein YdjX (TVP38/TMEM64 family)
LLLVLVAAAAALLWQWRDPILTILLDEDRTRRWIGGLGPWGPLVTIGLNTAQVLLAPFPGHIIGLANGYLYGVWLGTLYSMLGLLLGTALAMGLARRFGRPLVERLVNPNALARWDSIARRQGPPFFFLVYLIPGLPDDLICFLIGLSRLALPRMIVLAMLGRLPGVFVSCWVGAYATELPWWVWIPLGLGTAGMAWGFWRYRVPLEAALVGFIRRVTGQRGPRPGPEDSAVGEESPTDR